ncbi:MAG: hypothetical protein KME50_22030 [Nostoc desertorum CM1-VF14]|nr:hypothetical protein [Nostoc desertorum CM1-VF14]
MTIIIEAGVKGDRRLPVKEPDFSPDLLDGAIASIRSRTFSICHDFSRTAPCQSL